jgi:Flp pilus assembly protein TadD
MIRMFAVTLTLLLILPACDRRRPRQPERRPGEEGAAVSALFRRPPLPTLASPEPPPEAARRQYRAALAEGRALLARGHLGPAHAAFRRALAAVPGDPVALSELGWVAYRQGRLAEAEEATRRSLARARPEDRGVRAASLYNLGQIQRRRGDLRAAAESFQQSLRARDHRTVRAALARLSLDRK